MEYLGDQTEVSDFLFILQIYGDVATHISIIVDFLILCGIAESSS